MWHPDIVELSETLFRWCYINALLQWIANSGQTPVVSRTSTRVQDTREQVLATCRSSRFGTGVNDSVLIHPTLVRHYTHYHAAPDRTHTVLNYAPKSSSVAEVKHKK